MTQCLCFCQDNDLQTWIYFGRCSAKQAPDDAFHFSYEAVVSHNIIYLQGGHKEMEEAQEERPKRRRAKPCTSTPCLIKLTHHALLAL